MMLIVLCSQKLASSTDKASTHPFYIIARTQRQLVSRNDDEEKKKTKKKKAV